MISGMGITMEIYGWLPHKGSYFEKFCKISFIGVLVLLHCVRLPLIDSWGLGFVLEWFLNYLLGVFTLCAVVVLTKILVNSGSNELCND